MDFLIKLLTSLLVLTILITSIGGYYAWKLKVRPKLVDLEAKDKVKYSEMFQHIKSLHFPQAQKLFLELEAMTQNEVTKLKYSKFNIRWQQDKEFRQEVLLKQKNIRKRHKETMSYIYEGKQDSIYSSEKPKNWVLKEWGKMNPWEKGLVLREKCFKYLNQEFLKNKKRNNALALTRLDELGKKIFKSQDTSELCGKWIPIDQKEETVDKGLENLKKNLSYLGFSSILKELGISNSKIFSFSTQFNRFLHDNSS